MKALNEAAEKAQDFLREQGDRPCQEYAEECKAEILNLIDRHSGEE